MKFVESWSGNMCENLGMPITSTLTAVYWTCCNWEICAFGSPYITLLQQSSREVKSGHAQLYADYPKINIP